MSDDIFIKHEIFQKEMLANKPCFLLGNGICRYMGAPDWSGLLAKAMEAAAQTNASANADLLRLLHSNDVKEDVLNHPEMYTAMLIERDESKSRDTLKIMLKNIFEKRHSCRLLEYAKSTKSQILTTNFDFAIEQALGFPVDKNGFCTPSKAKDAPNSKVYPYGDYFAESKRDGLCLEGEDNADPHIEDECAVWHIHGAISKPQSVLLGFEDYILAILHLKRLQSHSPEVKNHYAEPWEDGFILKNSWLRLFFTRPLVIVGCGIKSEELFLRWLLVRRRRKKILTNEALQPIYYLDTEQEASKYPALDLAKQTYFKSLGIKIVRYANYTKLYDGSQWETP